MNSDAAPAQHPVLNGSISRQLEQPAPRIISATQGAGLHCFETAKRGGASEQQHVWPHGPGSLPMLMDVSKQHRPQGAMGTQQLLKTGLIEEPDRIHAGITDGDRWMVKRNHQGQITALRAPQALRKPMELKRAKDTGS